MAALKRRGLVVQPFKCGPDFIDPGHHQRVCGRPSRNLDGWMLSPATNLDTFCRHAASADISVVEGVMGLFDGASRSAGAGSTAEMATILSLPIIFVLDASKMAASAAAVVHGFATFDPAVQLAGVIFNKIGGASHYGLLKDALERAGDTVARLPAARRTAADSRAVSGPGHRRRMRAVRAGGGASGGCDRAVRRSRPRVLEVAHVVAGRPEPAASPRHPPVRIGVARIARSVSTTRTTSTHCERQERTSWSSAPLVTAAPGGS
jgi:hypothetical protein